MNSFVDTQIEETKLQMSALQVKIVNLEKQKEKTKDLNGMEKWLGFHFESSSGLTQEFAQFARDFKKHIKSVCSGYELVGWNRGHFEVSSFIKNKTTGKFVYFSCSDVRHFSGEWYNDLLVRTAKHDNDWTGGRNNSCELKHILEMVDKLTV